MKICFDTVPQTLPSCPPPNVDLPKDYEGSWAICVLWKNAFHLISLDFTEFHWISLEFIGIYWISLQFIAVHMIVVDFTSLGTCLLLFSLHMGQLPSVTQPPT